MFEQHILTLCIVGDRFAGSAVHEGGDTLRARGGPRSAYDRLTADLRRLAADGASRTQVNRAHFRLYRDETHKLLVREGVRWFGANRDCPGFFLPTSARALRRHTHTEGD
ncbi:hypothetical protein [Nocardiopsis alborubida]|uniref:Uncharacterized protein n=1 Tax=Nocardiopsis alborubida TaxID=146802 RepID=A0A7X6RT86_9ACTN|nr:hypothetical protein [Nocardiopsis alborubida]NKZ01123.1 hypothetical protein [Nocardiopsis alborubida]